MKERTTKVEGLIEKAGLAKGSEIKLLWPENLKELAQLVGKQRVGNVEVEITEEKIVQYAFRGFTLSFQGGGEPLTEEEAAARKIKRKADNTEVAELRKMAKEQGVSLAELIKTLKA